jgi:hypothetical protein
MPPTPDPSPSGLEISLGFDIDCWVDSVLMRCFVSIDGDLRWWPMTEAEMARAVANGFPLRHDPEAAGRARRRADPPASERPAPALEGDEGFAVNGFGPCEPPSLPLAPSEDPDPRKRGAVE